MAEKKPDPLDQVTEDIHIFWAQIRKETRERILPDEHWIWPTIFAALMIVGMYIIPKLILEFCECLNYTKPL